MKLFILGAGLGKRMGKLVTYYPKSLLVLHDSVRILDWQVRVATENWNVEKNKIFFIGGYKSTVAKQYCDLLGIHFGYNPFYMQYNNVYSFFLISQHCENEDFLVLNGDTVFSKSSAYKIKEKVDVLRKSRRNKTGFFVFVHSKSVDEEDMKVVLSLDGSVSIFGKDVNPDSACGEFVGLSFIPLEIAKHIFSVFSSLISKGATSLWYEQGFNECIWRGIKCWPIVFRDLCWAEIDTPSDLSFARCVVSEGK